MNQKLIKDYSKKFIKQTEDTAKEFTGLSFQTQNISLAKYLSTTKDYNCLMRMRNKEVELLYQVSGDKKDVDKFREIAFERMNIKTKDKKRDEEFNHGILLEFCNHYAKIDYEDFESVNRFNEEGELNVFVDYEENEVEREMVFFNLINEENDIKLEVRFMFYPHKQGKGTDIFICAERCK